jgi:hypothetical protein
MTETYTQQQQAGREASWLKEARKQEGEIVVKETKKMKSGRQDPGGRGNEKNLGKQN